MNIIKRKANLIPYCFIDNQFEFYLSLRSKNAKQYPDIWSFWGGGIEENESAEQAMLREIKEELDWVPKQYIFLGTHLDSMPNEKSIYFSYVDKNFEKEIKILESQGGKFFSIEDIEKEEKMIEEDKGILKKLYLTIRG